MSIDASPPVFYALVTLTATAGLVLFDVVDWRPGRAVAKTIAATGFVAAAWAGGAMDSAYGRWILTGLAFSWVGDIALLARGTPGLFRLGLGSFLVGHLAYSVAFVVRGISLPVGALMAALLVGPVVLTLRWLGPHVSDSMRTPVRAYVAVITAMVAFAAATVAFGGNAWILVGALLFYVSDLAVARERFVTPSVWNGVWGSPAYFLGQVVLALTVR